MIPLVAGLASLATAAAQNPAIDAKRQISELAGRVSFGMMVAAGRDACHPTRKEDAIFRQRNGRRWDHIEAALQDRFGSEIVFGVVIPEGCLRARSIPLSKRRATYLSDLRALEQALAIPSQE